MKRLAVAMWMLACSGLVVGCRTAHTPYDYTPPVADSQFETHGGRAGSNLTAPTGYEVEGEYETLESFEEPPAN